MTVVGWVELEHPQTGGRTRVPDDDAVLAAHAGRGWVRAEPAEPVAVQAVRVPAETEWVRLRHTETGGVQEVPPDPDVIADAQTRGWVIDSGDEPAAAPVEVPVQEQAMQEPAAVGKERKGVNRG